MAEAAVRSWKAEVQPVEMGCRGFVTSSTSVLLKDLRISGQELRKALANSRRKISLIWISSFDCGGPDSSEGIL